MKKLVVLLMFFMIVIAGLAISKKVSTPEDMIRTINPAGMFIDLSMPEAKPVIESSITHTPADLYVDQSGFVTSFVPVTSDGNINVRSATFDAQEIEVIYSGTSVSSASLYKEGISLFQGKAYHIYFTASSTVDRAIQVQLRDQNTDQILFYQDVSVGPNTQEYNLDYVMNNATTHNGALYFAIGAANPLDYHILNLNHIRLQDLSDSPSESVRVNQCGYLTNERKIAIIPYTQGDVADIIDVNTQQSVFSAPILNRMDNTDAGEVNYTIDFSDFTTPGTYYIRTQIGQVSPRFIVADNPFPEFANGMLRMLSLQRCGMDLYGDWTGGLDHAQCHTAAAQTLDGRTLDVSGGFHDAGDYGRYVKTTAKMTIDLLMSYMMNPNLFNDNTGTAGSGNHVNDVLDEARYAIEWMMKMQDGNGGVYGKAVTQQFPGSIVPEQDTAPLYVLDIDSASTADYSATLALASIVYRNKDAQFAEDCLNRSMNAYFFLAANPNMMAPTNPEGFNAGEYRDVSDQDERLMAALMLYAATAEQRYEDDAKNMYNSSLSGTSWQNMGTYGRFIYCLTAEDSPFKEQLINDLRTEADNLVNTANGRGYRDTVYTYEWGSNGIIANNGLILMMAYELTDNHAYKNAAIEQANNVLGMNALNTCFVSGYGTHYPTNVHSRVAHAKNMILNGALVGGPNNSREDGESQKLGWDVPPAKVYVDSYDSYSTNEISIYWNSALINLIAFITK